jgi:Coenzyme PQQ synthesis protein D (PqqD)
MASRQKWPKARRKDLLVEQAESEVLVYDLERSRVHFLNESAAVIWRLCNGRRSPSEIAEQLDGALDLNSRTALVEDTIGQLARKWLVSDEEGKAPQISRRELVRKIGIGAAAAGIVVPLVMSISAPPAYAASSCSGLQVCDSNCCSRIGQVCCKTSNNNECNSGTDPCLCFSVCSAAI